MSQDIKSSKKNGVIHYFEESFQELRKVTWPTRQQAVRLTFLVLGFCVIAAVVIGVLDFVFSYGHKKLVDLAPAGASISTPIDNQVPVSGATVTTEDGQTIPIDITPTPAPSN